MEGTPYRCDIAEVVSSLNGREKRKTKEAIELLRKRGISPVDMDRAYDCLQEQDQKPVKPKRESRLPQLSSYLPTAKKLVVVTLTLGVLGGFGHNLYSSCRKEYDYVGQEKASYEHQKNLAKWIRMEADKNCDGEVSVPEFTSIYNKLNKGEFSPFLDKNRNIHFRIEDNSKDIEIKGVRNNNYYFVFSTDMANKIIAVMPPQNCKVDY